MSFKSILDALPEAIAGLDERQISALSLCCAVRNRQCFVKYSQISGLGDPGEIDFLISTLWTYLGSGVTSTDTIEDAVARLESQFPGEDDTDTFISLLATHFVICLESAFKVILHDVDPVLACMFSLENRRAIAIERQTGLIDIGNEDPAYAYIETELPQTPEIVEELQEQSLDIAYLRATVLDAGTLRPLRLRAEQKQLTV